MDKRLYLFERLNEVTRAFSATPDVPSFLNLVVETAAELTQTDRAAILLWQDEPPQWKIGALVGMTASALAFEEQPQAVPGTRLKHMGQFFGVLHVPAAQNNPENALVLSTLAGLAAAALAVQRSHEQVAELDRMKNDVIAITSHELRTPLGLVFGHATFLREMVDDEYRPQLDVIIRGALRLKEIIESMTHVDNYQSGAALINNSLISLRAVLDDVVQTFEPQAAEKNIRFSLSAPTQTMQIEGDAAKIGTAIHNIVHNALTYTNKDGEVRIIAEQIPGYVKISVCDNGIGIPAKDLPHIFDRFYQVESHLTRQHGGMGMGLSVCKAMVELHGGRIWVESVEGKGSEFVMLLPTESLQQ
jgi:signal transduction histidine kinase